MIPWLFRELIDALRKAIESKDDEQAKQQEHKQKLETLEQELVELLTLNQEAQLTVLDVVNSDGMGGFSGERAIMF